jgi:hypothetical protein
VAGSPQTVSVAELFLRGLEGADEDDAVLH